MNTPLGLIKNFTATTAIPQRRICALTAVEGEAKLATSGADALIGPSGIRGAAADERVDLYLTEVQEIEAGGPVAVGDRLTCDDQGRVIVAAPGAGVTVNTIGVALSVGILGSTIATLVERSSVTGA